MWNNKMGKKHKYRLVSKRYTCIQSVIIKQRNGTIGSDQALLLGKSYRNLTSNETAFLVEGIGTIILNVLS